MRTITIEAGMSIDQAARHMVRQADTSNDEVRAKFNDFELVALPGDTVDHVAKPYWNEAARRERHYEAVRTLSARVVEAAVERVLALRADGGDFLGLRHQRALAEECAAVDALIAERGGR